MIPAGKQLLVLITSMWYQFHYVPVILQLQEESIRKICKAEMYVGIYKEKQSMPDWEEWRSIEHVG